MQETKNFFYLASSFLLLFGVCEVLYQYLHFRAEWTRKIAHAGTGLLTFLFPVMLDNHWLVLVLCASFALILTASLRWNFLRSINGVDRETVGSLCFPVSVYLCFLFYSAYDMPCLFYLPILVLAFSDPLAALFGRKFPVGRYTVMGQDKTVVGSAVFFVSATLLLVLYRWFGVDSHIFSGMSSGSWILLVFVIVALSTLAEALSSHGWDNLSIPLTILIILIVSMQNTLVWNL